MKKPGGVRGRGQVSPKHQLSDQVHERDIKPRKKKGNPWE